MASGRVFSSLIRSRRDSSSAYATALVRNRLLPPRLRGVYFSTIPTRPMRGERTSDRSQDHFPRKFNINNDENTIIHSRSRSSDQFGRRPMRAELRADRIPRKFGFGTDADDRNARNAPRTAPDQSVRRRERRDELDSTAKARKSHHAFSNEKTVGEDEGSNELFDRDLRPNDDAGEYLQSLESEFLDENRDGLSSNPFLKQFGRDSGAAEDNGTETAPRSPPAQPPPTKTAASDVSPQDADEIFRKMKETGLIPNAVAMLDGLCKDGLIQEAMTLFGLMREKGTVPEVVIYTAVVEGFCKAAKYDDAKRIFRKMQSNRISPNAFSYAVLIQGLIKGKRLEDSVDFCVEMLEAGHSPNVATFVSLIDECCRGKGAEEASSVIGRLREKGFAVDDRAVREHMGKRGPFSPSVWEAIFGKKNSQKIF